MALLSNDRAASRYSTMLPERVASASWALRAIFTRALCTTAWVSACVMKSSMPGSAVLFSRTGTWTDLMPGGRLVRRE